MWVPGHTVKPKLKITLFGGKGQEGNRRLGLGLGWSPIQAKP